VPRSRHSRGGQATTSAPQASERSLFGGDSVTKAPHDLPKSGAFSCSRVRKGCYGIGWALVRGGRTSDTILSARAARGKKRADKGVLHMKNVYEVLRQKELEVSRLKREVEALRVAAPLLSEGEDGGNDKKAEVGH
jgi:hypothetical protein